MTIFQARALLVYLPVLLLTSCTASRQAVVMHPPPTEVLGPDEGESELRRAWEIWNEIRHRTPPGVSWRAVEAENRRRNLALHAAGPDTTASLHWRERGSFDQTGRTEITAVGTDGETLFIGSANGGLFSGTPGSGRWVPRSDSLGIGFQSFVIVPALPPENPEVWVAAATNAPLYVSTNQGLTWSQATGSPSIHERVVRIVRDPGQARRLYALTLDRQDYKLYRSENGGLELNMISTGRDIGWADLWIDRIEGGPLYLASRRGLQVSSDGGLTFSTLAPLPAPMEEIVLAGSEAGAPTLYAAIKSPESGEWQVFLSEDGGHAWEAGSPLPRLWPTLTASISDPKLVFAGGVNAYRSTNAGRTFRPIDDWKNYYTNPDTRLHADMPGIDCTLYQGREVVFFNTDGGTYLSEDGGRTVRNITRFGFGNGQYYSTLTTVNDSRLIAAGAQDQGYQMSQPGSGDILGFNQVSSGDYGNLSSSDGTHNMLYAAYTGFILLQKREGADVGEQDFEQIELPVPREQRRHPWIPAVVADPDDSGVVYYADRQIWRIERQGPDTYAARMLPHDFGADEQVQDFVTAFAISPADRNRWYAGTAYGRVWHSRDGGNTWTSGKVFQDSSVSDLLPSPTDPDVCYLSGSGYGGHPVFRTLDGGATWSDFSNGLPPTRVAALAYDDPVRQDLYAASDAGAFKYDKPSKTWVNLLGTEAPLTIYENVEAVPQDGVMRFATYGRGIWDYSPEGEACIAGERTLCLQDGRFEVEVAWKDFSGGAGEGHVVPGSGTESGLFWFFQPANWELMVKVLDACSLSNRFWIFSAATTTVEYTLRVRDTWTGQTVEYRNPSGQASPAVTDTGSFACSAPAASPHPGDSSPSTDTTLTLAGRIRVEMDWRDFQDGRGQGHVTPLRSGDSGIFWFFTPTNWEALTKVVDGCSLNGHYWVFGAALTTVEYTLRVTDTVTGQHREYFNPLGRISPTIADTNALPCN
jgi:photosystem II stability/assembly factor-like uncharacterized protein